MGLAAPDPKDWRIQQAIILRSADADVVKLLRQAQADVLVQLRDVLARPAGIGRDVREAQLRLIQRNLYQEMAKVYRELGKLTEARRAEAVARSVDFSQSMDTFKLTANGVPGGADVAQAIADSELDTARSGIDRMIARTTGASYIPLVQRVYNSNVGLNEKIDRLVNSALARGLSAREFATEVRGFINPATPGGVRYAAMRLARTEINNAAHAMAIQSAQGKPWVEAMHWNLSGSHGRPDICNTFASGGPKGDGNYPVHSVPAKPHPQCLCYVTPEMVDDDEFVDNLIAGKYESYISKYRNLQPGQVVRSDFGGGFPGPRPKAPPLKATKVGKSAPKGAKPPSHAKPPEPGAAPLAPHVPPAVEPSRSVLRAEQLAGEGVSLPTARRVLAKEMGITPEEAEKILRKAVEKHPTSIMARQVKLTAPKPTTVLKPVAPRPITELPPPSRVSDRVSGLERSDRVALNEDLRAANRLDGTDAELIQEEMEFQAKVFPESAETFVALKGRVEYIEGSIWDDRTAANVLAHYDGNLEAIRFRKATFDPAFDRSMRAAERSGFKTVCGADHYGAQSTFAHEFGHFIDRRMFSQANHARRHEFWSMLRTELRISDELPDLIDPFGIPFRNWFKAAKPTIERELSTYAGASPAEMIAEIWREYSTNKHARPLIKRLGKLLHDIAKEAR